VIPKLQRFRQGLSLAGGGMNAVVLRPSRCGGFPCGTVLGVEVEFIGDGKPMGLPALGPETHSAAIAAAQGLKKASFRVNNGDGCASVI